MRIVHVHDFASVASRLAAGQRALGHTVKVLARSSPILDSPDSELPPSRNFVADAVALVRVRRHLRDADVVHLHGGIWRSHLFWLAVRFRSRRYVFVVHLHGTDARSGKGAHYLRIADYVFCSTPDLRRFVSRAEWLPSPVTVPPDIPLTRNAKPMIGHFPTDRAVKGTERILAGFAELGPSHESQPEPGVTQIECERAVLLIVERVPHARALEVMDGCDVVVDQVNGLGIYSTVSVEAMARAKVTLSSYDPSFYPGTLPIVRLTRDTVGRTFQTVLSSRDRWREWSAQARTYVERVHNPLAVAYHTVELYRAIQRRRAR